jgi:hypothetical protein
VGRERVGEREEIERGLRDENEIGWVKGQRIRVHIASDHVSHRARRFRVLRRVLVGREL